MANQFGKEIIENLNINESLQGIIGYQANLLHLKYEIAQSHYREQSFQKAKEIFAYLALLEPSNKSYWMSLASCQAKLKMSQEALKSYLAASLLDPEDPAPHLCSSYCYLLEGQKTEAISALKSALKLSKNNFKNRAIEKVSSEIQKILEGLKP